MHGVDTGAETSGGVAEAEGHVGVSRTRRKQPVGRIHDADRHEHRHRRGPHADVSAGVVLVSALWMLDRAPVIDGTITVPIQGAWTAEVTVDATAAPEAGERVTVDASGAEYSGTVQSVSSYGGRGTVRVIGGAGALRQELQPRSYTQTTVGVPLGDIATQTGEAFDQTTLAVAGATPLPAWALMAQEAQRGIQALADALGLRWRVLRSGYIAIAPDASGDYAGAYTVLESDDTRGWRMLAVDSCDAEPGQVLDGVAGEQLVYTLGEGGQRLSLTTQSTGGALARAAGPTRDMARMATLWLGSVVATNGDGTVDVAPDSPKIRGRGYQRVPLWSGVPGTVRVPVGSRVLLLFSDGSPAHPVAALFGGSGLTSLAIGAGTDAVALASLVTVELGKIAAAITSLGGAYVPAPVASTKVLVE